MNQGSVERRLLSPSAGGCLAFIPLWSVYPAVAVGLCIYVLLQRRG